MKSNELSYGCEYRLSAIHSGCNASILCHIFNTEHPTPNVCVLRGFCRKAILKTGSFDRDELEEIESEMSQKTRLWRGIQTFEERLEIWKSTPFQDLDFEGVDAEIVRYGLWASFGIRIPFSVEGFMVSSKVDDQKSSKQLHPYVMSCHVLSCHVVSHQTFGAIPCHVLSYSRFAHDEHDAHDVHDVPSPYSDPGLLVHSLYPSHVKCTMVDDG